MAAFPKLLFYIAGLTLLLLPFLSEYLKGLWEREIYQFYPIALIAALGLIISRHGSPMSRRGWSRLLGGGLAFAGLCVLAFGVYVNSPWLCYVAFVTLVGVGLMHFGDKEGPGSLLYLILPLLLTVRPPLQLDVKAVQKLQHITSVQASSVLNIIGIDHIRAGNVIEPLGESSLMVEEACSGVQSMFTLLFLASMISVSARYKIVRTIALLLLAVFWSGVMNTARVVSIVVARTWYDVDLISGTPHELLGYAVLVGAALLLLSSDQLCYFVISPITSSAKHRLKNPFVAIWNRMTIVGTPDEISPESNGWKWVLSISLAASLLIMLPAYFGSPGTKNDQTNSPPNVDRSVIVVLEQNESQYMPAKGDLA